MMPEPTAHRLASSIPKVKEINDQELPQSEPNSHPRNLNWKQPKLQIDIIKTSNG